MPDLDDLVADLLSSSGAARPSVRPQRARRAPARAAATRVAQSTRLRSARTVGRDQVLAAGAAMLQPATAGHLAVVGAAGTGKSRVLADLESLAGQGGVVVVRGRASPHDRGEPYRPLAEWATALAAGRVLDPSSPLWGHRAALGLLVPAWGDASAGPVSPFVVSEALAALVEQAEAPVLLLVDDVHWADVESLQVLDALVRRPGSAYHLLVASRPDGAADELLTSWERDTRLDLWRLGPLDADDATTLAYEVAGGRLPHALTEVLVDRSDGLPLVVEELVNALVADGALRPVRGGFELRDDGAFDRVPASLTASVRERLATLSTTTVRLVRGAALLGREFSTTDLTGLTGLDPDEVRAGLDTLVAQGLVERVTGAARADHRFGHALTREAVLGGVSEPELRDLAAAALDREVAGGEAPVDLERRAELALIADRPDAAADLLRSAGLASMRQGALGSAERQLRRALSVPGGSGPATAVDLVEVLARAGRHEQAVVEGESALAGAQGEDQHRDRARLHLALARASEAVDDLGAAARHLDAVDEPGPETDLVRSRVLLGERRLEEGQAAAVAALRAHTGPEQACEALELLARCARTRSEAEAESILERMAALAEDHGLDGWQLRALSELGTLDLFRLGDGRRLVAARDVATSRGDLVTATVVGYHEAIRRFHGVELDGWRTWVDGVGADATAFGLAQIADATSVLRAAFTALTGDLDLARAQLGDLDGRGPLDPDREASLWGIAHAVLALVEDDVDQARSHLERGVGAVADREFGDPSPMWGAHALLSTLAGGTGDADDIRRRGTTVNRVNAGLAAWCDALENGRKGAVDLASAAARDALDLLAPAPFYAAIAIRHMWLVARAQGWSGGWEGAARSAASYLLEQGYDAPGRALARSLGTAPDADDELTPREREVLAEVREGRTNAQIAERLFISPRTVEKHVERLLAKTGASNRTQLATRDI